MRPGGTNELDPAGIRRVGVRMDLLLTSMLTLLCGALTTEGPRSPALHIVAGVLLVLILPGYSLSALVFPDNQLGKTGRLLCTLGISLAVAALGGLLLDVLPGHMSRSDWVLLLGIVALVAAIGAMLRVDPRLTADTTEQKAVQAPRARRSRWALLAFEMASGVAAVLIAIAAVALAMHAERKSPAFSELSALPVSIGRARALRIELQSEEHSPMRYTVTVREDGKVSQSWHHVLLLPGQRWQRLSGPARHRTQRVVVTATAQAGSTPTLQTTFYPHPQRAIARPRRRRVAAHLRHLPPAAAPTHDHHRHRPLAPSRSRQSR